MKFQMSPLEYKNFCVMKIVMKEYGYFYSGPRVEEDEVKLIFQKYGTGNEDLIAYSYGKLQEVTEAKTFTGWFTRSLNELFPKKGETNA